ncbi:hypothetical protein BCV70DRAFT_198561 [Testicularia cyperi]|uniref:Uncharacterized protein n=1 Tax=Testicularia cyperi TaxID=1882483 RepID=A0A317XWS6_9BASI|nr:hypothetical protein BCV70DRAFT_198561 [Testicularia cyperi]
MVSIGHSHDLLLHQKRDLFRSGFDSPAGNFLAHLALIVDEIVFVASICCQYII